MPAVPFLLLARIEGIAGTGGAIAALQRLAVVDRHVEAEGDTEVTGAATD